MSDGGIPLPLPLSCLDTAQRATSLPDPFIAIGSREQAWQNLVDHAVPQDELLSLIETIFSDEKATEMVDGLQESNAQAFIDVIDEVRHRTLSFRGMGQYVSLSTFYILSVRHWVTLTSRHVSGGGV